MISEKVLECHHALRGEVIVWKQQGPRCRHPPQMGKPRSNSGVDSFSPWHGSCSIENWLSSGAYHVGRPDNLWGPFRPEVFMSGKLFAEMVLPFVHPTTETIETEDVLAILER